MSCAPIGKGFVCTTSYAAGYEAAMEHWRHGEFQVYCLMCGRWRWPAECAHPNRMSTREFNRVARNAKP